VGQGRVWDMYPYSPEAYILVGNEENIKETKITINYKLFSEGQRGTNKM
jgi:hypothetical protein